MSIVKVRNLIIDTKTKEETIEVIDRVIEEEIPEVEKIIDNETVYEMLQWYKTNIKQKV